MTTAPSTDEIVRNLISPNDMDSWGDDFKSQLFAGLTEVLDEVEDNDYRNAVNTLALLVRGRGSFESLIILRGTLLERNHDLVRKASTHLEWIAQRPVELGVIFAIYTALDNEADPEFQSSSRNIEAQADAFCRIRDTDYPFESYLRFSSEYFYHTKFLDLVDRHADHVHALLKYREDRGLDNGPEMGPHDEEDFAAYLRHGTVAEGWL